MGRITPSISLNEEEQETLAEWQRFAGEPDRSRAIKYALNFARNVALGLFGTKLSESLTTRNRYDFLESKEKEQKEREVWQRLKKKYG